MLAIVQVAPVHLSSWVPYLWWDEGGKRAASNEAHCEGCGSESAESSGAEYLSSR